MSNLKEMYLKSLECCLENVSDEEIKEGLILKNCNGGIMIKNIKEEKVEKVEKSCDNNEINNIIKNIITLVNS